MIKTLEIRIYKQKKYGTLTYESMEEKKINQKLK